MNTDTEKQTKLFHSKIIMPGQRKYDEITALLPSIFPLVELVPEEMFAEQVPYLGFFDGDTFIGFAQVVKTSYLHFLLYLAVLEPYRAKSYGSKALQCILADRGNVPLVLNIEPLDKESDNYEQRVQRACFYQRNGLVDSGYTFQSDECLLSIYSTGECGAAPSLEKLFDEAFRYGHGAIKIFKKQ